MPVTNYHWVGDNVLWESDGAGATTVAYTYEPAQYGRLISEHRGSETSQYHFDAIGSTHRLTDATPTVTDSWVFTSSGSTIAHAGPSHTSVQWCGAWGYAVTAEKRTISIRRRDYSPDLGRWTSVDEMQSLRGLRAIPFEIFSNCHYIYSRNSLLSRTDPSGLICRPTVEGMTYIPGRANLTHGSVGAGSTPASSHGVFRFSLDSGSFFNIPMKDACCCCDNVGIVQIARYGYDYALLPHESAIGLWDLITGYWSPRWFVDGGIPYTTNSTQYRTTDNPCSSGPKGTLFALSDEPTFQLDMNGFSPLNIPGYRRLLSAYHTFETCLVCLHGIEGPVGDGITVYGCIKWGHSFAFNKSKSRYVTYRYLLNNGVLQSGKDVELVAEQLSPPSDVFKTSVIGTWLYNLRFHEAAQDY